MLHALFTHPALLSPALLDQSKERKWPLANGMKVTLTGGWFVWVIVSNTRGSNTPMILGGSMTVDHALA